MSAVLQDVLVGLLVAFSAGYSVWRLLPPLRRLQVLDGLERIPAGALRPVLARARARALARLSGGCGACAPRNRTTGALRR